MPHKRAKRSVREQQRKERDTDLAPSGGINNTGISTERIPKSVARVLDAARIRAEYRQKRARLQTDEVDANDGTGSSKPSPAKKRRTNSGVTESEKVSKVRAKGKDHPVGTIEIQPGESLKHFNRRVEDHMRPLVRSAVRASAATERKARKAATVAAASSHKNADKIRQPSKASPSSVAHKSSKTPAEGASLPLSSARARHDDDDNDLPKEFATTSSSAPRRLNDVALAPPDLKKLPRGVAKLPSSSGKAKAGAGVLSMAQRVMMEVERENAIRRYREMRQRKNEEGDRTLLRDEERVDGG